MEFLNTFDVGDIIGFCSLVVGVIGLIFVKPIYKHFNSLKIGKSINNSNFGNININSGSNIINQTIVSGFNMTNKNITNLDDNGKIDE